MRLTNKELKQYRFHRAQDRRYAKKISDNTYPTSDIVQAGEPGRHLSIHGLANTPQMREWARRRDSHQERCMEIERFIDGIEDDVTRSIFEIRYLVGGYMPTWEEVAARIGGGNSGDGVRMAVARYLKEH